MGGALCQGRVKMYLNKDKKKRRRPLPPAKKCFPDKVKLKEYITTKPLLYEMLQRPI